jgi:hypothetical protein
MLLEDGDLLWVAVLRDVKLTFRQTADSNAAICNHHIH